MNGNHGYFPGFVSVANETTNPVLQHGLNHVQLLAPDSSFRNCNAPISRTRLFSFNSVFLRENKRPFQRFADPNGFPHGIEQLLFRQDQQLDLEFSD